MFTETWSTLGLTEIRYFEGPSGLAINLRMQGTAVATGKSVDTMVGHFLIFQSGLIREFNMLDQDPVQLMNATRP